jgi:ABC-2 type transport system permease protein
MASTTGTWTLIRFILRRDRIRIPIWIVGIVGFFLLVAASFPTIYPTEQERQARAQLMENPTAMAFRGPGYGFDDYTYGAMLAHELMGYAAIAVALMSIFLVVRHTRTEEETGRQELVRASVVGRYASPVAALTVVVAVNLVIVGLFAGLLQVIPGDYSMHGALAFGLGLAAVGIVFAGIGAVASQLSEFGRGASGMAVLALGSFYLVRAVGDVQDNVLRWLSPIGWAQATRPFVDERWWPLLIAAGFAVLVIAVAFILINRRDVGAGIFPEKPGPANAGPRLAHPVGFALNQQRGGLIGWTVGVAIIGFAFGSLIGDIEAFVDDNPQLEEFMATGEATLMDGFLGLVVMVMAFMATGFAVGSAMRPRSQETDGLAEPLLTTGLPRVSWLRGYLLVSMLGSAVILLVGSAALGAVAALDQNDISLFTGSLGAALAYLPAIWLVTGLTAALFGALPRLLVIPWLVLIFGVFIGLFGDMLNVPGWAKAFSPFDHVPDLPGGAVEPWSIAMLLVVATLLIALGQYSFRNRDLEMN